MHTHTQRQTDTHMHIQTGPSSFLLCRTIFNPRKDSVVYVVQPEGIERPLSNTLEVQNHHPDPDMTRPTGSLTASEITRERLLSADAGSSRIFKGSR